MSSYYDEDLDVLQEIQGLTPPSLVWDGTLKMSFASWALNEAAALEYTVKIGYVAATDLYLRFIERTDGSVQKHKWEATVTITIDGTTSDPEVFVAEYTSPAVADTLMQRSIPISGTTGDHASTAGQIHTTAIVAEAVIAIQLKRIAASADEDANEIENTALLIRSTLSSDAGVDCLGRLGEIITDVYEQFNVKPGSGHLGLNMVTKWVNECKDRIAKQNYWRSTQLIDMTASTETYDLSSLITDHTYLTVASVRYVNGDVSYQLKLIQTRKRFEMFKVAWSSSSLPMGYYMEGDTMYLCPTPGSTATDVIKVEYFYTPADLHCTTNPTPPTPSAYDSIYVSYCLYKAYGRDRHAPMAAQLKKDAYQDFLGELNDLMRKGRPRAIVMRPYR